MSAESSQTCALYWITAFVLVLLIMLTAMRVASTYTDRTYDLYVQPVYAEEM